MNRKEALEKSIAHWEENLNWAKEKKPSEITMGVEDCALCSLYFEKSCKGCPVWTKTGKPMCKDTPYAFVLSCMARLRLNAHEVDIDTTRQQLVTACEEEVNFLKSLRKR